MASLGFKSRLTVMLAALWWGNLTTVGFLVVPMLFAHLPTPAVAGAMAARLFTAQTWVSVACGLLLLLMSRARQEEGAASRFSPGVLMVLLAGLILALVAEFAVAPRIVAREDLKLWHSVGSGMYLVQWLCAGALFWRQAGKD